MAAPRIPGTELVRAVRYGSLDEARSALQEAMRPRNAPEIFDDEGEEPQGLLSVIPEDRVSEEDFVRLFGQRRGTLVEVERIPYSGYGPPAEEDDYMGFSSARTAYVLTGCRLPVEIENCPFGAVDIHHLEAMILDGEHPFDRADLARRFGLTEDWSFETLFDLIASGELTGEEVDRALHAIGRGGPEGGAEAEG